MSSDWCWGHDLGSCLSFPFLNIPFIPSLPLQDSLDLWRVCHVLNQLLLLHGTRYVPVNNVEDAWGAILLMHIYGASLTYTVVVLGC